LGASHVLLGISRMCLRDNVPLIFEMAALAILIRGWRSANFGLLALGGALAGLGSYSYFSARIIIVVWVAFLIAAAWRKALGATLPLAAKAALVVGVAFMVSGAPMFVATLQSPTVAMAYPKAQFVIYPEGRELLRQWEASSDTKMALLRST